MKRIWLWLAVIFQVAVVTWMAVQREWVLATGEVVWLRTAPLDPRDIFRGDYVELDYDVSILAADQQSQEIQEGDKPERGDRVYVSLVTGAGELAETGMMTLEPPSSGLYLKGRIKQDWRFGESRAQRVKYGIEKYFVEQGTGWELEKRRGARGQVQVPMEMEVALSAGGLAVIKGHRWSRLGIQLKRLEERPPEMEMGQSLDTPGDNETSTQDEVVAGSPAEPPAAAILELVLKNVSQQPLALALLPDNCSFSVKTTKWAPRQMILNQERCAAYAGASAEIRVLQAEEEYQIFYDFNDPQWLVEEDGKLVSIDSLQWNQQFRIIYRPPQVESPDGVDVWRGYLPSPSFNGGGRVD